MTIIEALTDPRFLSGELWARILWKDTVKSWDGNPMLGYAIRCRDGLGVWLAPKRGLKERRWAPSTHCVRCDWELVTPEQHLAELKAEEDEC